ncbi:MAG TPA: heliorhodopsin HeR [Mycobacterium sp.]|nr:heliorhodopsin HeR [Mycobacterium sp.]
MTMRGVEPQPETVSYRSVSVSDSEFAGLRRWNLIAATLHGAQGIAMLVLSTALALPVTALYASGPPGTPINGSSLTQLFTVRLGPAVATFLLLSAVFHLIVSVRPGAAGYRSELQSHRNRFRWVEYSLSSSLMIVLIAMITGISDVAALLTIFVVNASMIHFGWLMETTNDRAGKPSWAPFVMGCIAGVAPWFAISIYLIGAGADVPGFVYGIFISLFLFFNSFALNQWLQYRRIGRWTNYLTGERTYIALSLIAKSLLAWQVFANVLL